MGIRSNILSVFSIDDITSTSLDIETSSQFFMHEDPFDYYRNDQPADQYIPKTQHKCRKAFKEGLIGIEYYLEMATSLRPLIDESQDLDEITRLFSQHKLTMRPNPHSVKILRNMIQDPSPEIALYAAEGLNSIENSFIQKIQRVKNRIKNNEGKKYILNYICGLLYLEFSELLAGQRMIQKFYINESLNHLQLAYDEEPESIRIKRALARIYMLNGNYSVAISLFANIYSLHGKDINALFQMAHCYYMLHDVSKVITICHMIATVQPEQEDLIQSVIYQWIL